MAISTTSIQISGLSHCLIDEGHLSQRQAMDAQQFAAQQNMPLSSYLVESQLVDSHTLAQCASAAFDMPIFDLDSVPVEQRGYELISRNIMQQHHALPIKQSDHKLLVAIADPLNIAALDEFKLITGILTEAVLVEECQLKHALEVDNEINTTQDHLIMDDFLDQELDNIEFNIQEDNEQNYTPSSIDETPIVRFVNKILLDAINKKASDIHFEPYEQVFRIRFRIDGVLKEISSPPINLAPRICARIKVMSSLDISERRIPQDGRIKMQLSQSKSIDFRVNTCPTLFGEKIVVRILDVDSVMLDIDNLGLEKDQKQHFLEAMHKPHGMILVTGPTGSGKTVTLYSGLKRLNTTDRNISTAEDPAEINMPGINQVNIRPKVGLDFSSTLRAFLRQDPDVIMVGEIRDLETAEIAIKAAQTGHLVLSTLHTNDAPQTITRLVNMGVASYNIASAINLIIAQRLARTLCEKCKTPHELPPETLLEAGLDQVQIQSAQLYKAVGCSHCTDGHAGRIGLYQVLPISDAIERIIMEGGNAKDLAQQAIAEGITTLKQAALNKALQGMISLDEVNRISYE